MSAFSEIRINTCSSGGRTCPIALETRLSSELGDPSKARCIAETYEKHRKNLGSVFSWLNDDKFEAWLIGQADLLACALIDHRELLNETWDSNLLRVMASMGCSKEVDSALNKFFSALQEEWAAREGLPPPKQLRSICNIVILTRNCGTGHLTQATAIEESLSCRGYKVAVVNGGKSEYKASFFSNATWKTDFSSLRKQVRALDPHLIINTVAHHPQWNRIAYDLSRPGFLIHTDYEVDATCIKRAGRELPSIFHIGLADGDDETSKQAMLKACGSKNRYLALARPIGFPIRSAFHREEDLEELTSLRQKLNIQADERVILVMGHTDMHYEYAEPTALQLAHSVRDFAYPLHVVVVCGKEPDRQNTLLQKLQSQPRNNRVRVTIKGYLEEQEMADYMKVASRVSGQPGMAINPTGGSTSAEEAEMGVYVLRMPIRLESEQPNYDYLHRHDLAEMLEDKDVVNQVSRVLKWDGDPASVYRPPLNWRKEIVQLIQEAEKALPANQ